jgi:DNA-binding transcriptional ArsR family regulator
MSARQVRPLDMTREDRLVAILEAVGAPLPCRAIHERVADLFKTEVDLVRSIGPLLLQKRLLVEFRDGVRVYSAPKPTTPPPQPKPSNEDTMARNNAAGETREKFVELFNREKGWIAPAAIAAAVGMTQVGCKYHLTALEEQGVIKSRGKTSSRRYAHVSTPDEAPFAAAEAEPPKKRKPALRRKTAKARRQRREKHPPVQLPVSHGYLTPVAEPPANESMVCAINDTGALGITKGGERIALDPIEVRKLLGFLDHTKPLWHRKRAA